MKFNRKKPLSPPKEMGIKKAVYTANIGSYDVPKSLDPLHSKGWDALYFSDNPELKVPGWKTIFVDPPDVRNKRNNTIKARQIKVNSHLFLPEYDITLWIDASKYFVRAINQFEESLPNFDFVSAVHPERNCIYQELEHPKVIRSIGEENSIQIAEMMKQEGFPKRYGLHETQFIYRKNNKYTRMINNLWWTHMSSCSAYRDQVWLSFVLYQLELDAGFLPKNIEREFLHYIKHGHQKSTPNVIRKPKNILVKRIPVKPPTIRSFYFGGN